jgi:hypothetical protein
MTPILDPDKEVGLEGLDGWLGTDRNGDRGGTGGTGGVDGSADGWGASLISSASTVGICQGNSSTDVLSAGQNHNFLVIQRITEHSTLLCANLDVFCRVLM